MNDDRRTKSFQDDAPSEAQTAAHSTSEDGAAVHVPFLLPAALHERVERFCKMRNVSHLDVFQELIDRFFPLDH